MGKKPSIDLPERCPRCKVRELLERRTDPGHTACDYLQVYKFIPADPGCDHNRKCNACGLTFRIEDKAQEAKNGRKAKRS